MNKHNVEIAKFAATLLAFHFLSLGTFAWGQTTPPKFHPGLSPERARILFGHRHTGPLLAQERQGRNLAQATPQLAPEARRCLPDCNELLGKARKKGTVHIIVTLDAPNLPKFAHSGAPKDEQRRSRQTRKEAVTRVHDAFLAKLSGHKIKRIHKGLFTPDISMEVDASTLEQILLLPEVRVVGEPGVVRPSLFDSGPLLGAPGAWSAGNPGGLQAEGDAIAVDSNGNVYVVGIQNESTVTLKHSATGELMWSAFLGGNSGSFPALAVFTGNVYMTTSGENAEFSTDFLTAKYAPQ